MPLGLSGNGLITGFDPTASGFGKVLQVVRATDTTNRSTTSTSFVDASISVTITPQRNTSTILVMWIVNSQGDRASASETYHALSITDSSNNALSGAESSIIGTGNSLLESRFNSTLIGYSTPATLAATTYKGRFRSTNASITARLQNATQTGQMYAIEVSA